MPEPLLYESHCHTPLCKHATGEPPEYAAVALARGFKGITFTCHCPLPDGISASVRMAPDQFGDYVTLIAATREAFAGRLDVRLGLESDWFPGVDPWLEKLPPGGRPGQVRGSTTIRLATNPKHFTPGTSITIQNSTSSNPPARRKAAARRAPRRPPGPPPAR